jgi:hypothetical protein
VAVIEDHEAEALIVNFMRHVGTATEDQLYALARWANDVRVEQALLDLALSGEVAIVDMRENGEPVFVNRD